MTGFRFRYRLSGEAPTVQQLTMKDSETLHNGDLANLEEGLVDLAAHEDANLLGAIQQTVVGSAGVTKVDVIVDADAVYGVVDNNARKKGDTLDITGATGAQGVAASEKKELVVVAPSLATQETLVRVNVGKHHDNKAQ